MPTSHQLRIRKRIVFYKARLAVELNLFPLTYIREAQQIGRKIKVIFLIINQNPALGFAAASVRLQNKYLPTSHQLRIRKRIVFHKARLTVELNLFPLSYIRKAQHIS